MQCVANILMGVSIGDCKVHHKRLVTASKNVYDTQTPQHVEGQVRQHIHLGGVNSGLLLSFYFHEISMKRPCIKKRAGGV